MSVPGHKRTLLANVRHWGKPLLTAHRKLVEVLRIHVGEDECFSAYRDNYGFLKNQEAVLNSGTIVPLYSAALLLNWSAGRYLGVLNTNASISDAERWFLEERNRRASSEILAEEIQFDILESLRHLDFGFNFLDMLPYAAEVFETSDEIIGAFGPSRKSKRAAGIFYTPSDVSNFIVRYVLSMSKSETGSPNLHTWLDPACGTGCFLLSILHEIAETKSFASDKAALSYVEKFLFGVDVSPLALQSAAYALVLTCLSKESTSNMSLRDGLFQIGKNLAVHDATRIKSLQDLSRLFPSLCEGADFVVANPPYAKSYVSDQDGQRSLFDNPEKQKRPQELYPIFIRMLSKLSKESCGTGGMVVPLSIAYNTERKFQELRSFMRTNGGTWQLAHFDRTPDSLFGDDVKIRNTIVFYKGDKTRKALYTTNLIRWNSRARAQLFERVKFSEVPWNFACSVIPKYGDPVGKRLFSSLVNKPLYTLAEAIARAKVSTVDPKRLIRNASTAYNWLPFEKVTEASINTAVHSEDKYHYWASHTAEDTATIFALVHCRLSYWLWRVYGDGFHLTDRFIRSLPLAPQNFSSVARKQLEILGNRLWEEMSEQKKIGRNATVVTIAYSPYRSTYTIDQIDDLVVRELQLPEETESYLKEFVWQTIVAGREDELGFNPALREIIKEDA